MKVAMNSTTTMHSNMVNDIKIAKAAGFGGIEIQHQKLYRYLDAGYSAESLLPLLEGIEVVGVGALWDIERQGSAFQGFISEVERMCKVAHTLGAPMIQLCTGPVSVYVVQDFMAGKIEPGDKRYKGLLGEQEDKIIEYTAKNVASAADIASNYGLDIFLEPLAWTPINTIGKGLKVIEAAGRDNIGFAVDFWHMWTAGETSGDVARLDKKLIKIVHVCDGLEYDRRTVPDQEILRNVWTGEGNIPLKEWMDAVKSTGFDGWYSSEIFCNRAFEQDYLKTAATLKNFIDYLIA